MELLKLCFRRTPGGGRIMPTKTWQGVASSLLHQLAELPTFPTAAPASLSHIRSSQGLEKSHEIVVGAF